MIHTKFQDNRSSGSGGEGFTIHGHCGHSQSYEI